MDSPILLLLAESRPLPEAPNRIANQTSWEYALTSLTPSISSTHGSVRQGPISESNGSSHSEEEDNTHVIR
jgi:hypothetical protein